MQFDELKAQIEEMIEMREFGEARRAVDGALAAAPSDAQIINLMGIVEAAADHYDTARSWFQKAVALRPDNTGYRLNVAYQWFIAGEFNEAKEEFARVLAIEPNNPFAYWHLALITTAKPGDPMIDALEKLKDDTRFTDEARNQYCYALGKCYDDIGDYDRAFENYKAANDRQSGNFVLSEHKDLFSLIKQLWTKEFIEARRDWGFASKKPVFIVGMPRSGSTLLAQKLAGRAEIADLGEREDIFRIDQALQKGGAYPMFMSASGLQRQAFREFGEWYVESLSADAPDAKHFIDKNNVNWPYVGMIRAILPDALILNSRRSPIATCLSCYFADMNPAQNWAFSLQSLGQYYRLYDDLMRHWSETIPGFVAVRYESMVEDPEGIVESLYHRLGLSAAPAVQPSAAKPQIRTLSGAQARRPIYKSSVERWRNYEKHIGPLIDALGDLAV